MVTNQPPKRLRTIVGAIPCGRPAGPEGAYFPRIVSCGRPAGPEGAYFIGIVLCSRLGRARGGGYLNSKSSLLPPGHGKKIDLSSCSRKN